MHPERMKHPEVDSINDFRETALFWMFLCGFVIGLEVAIWELIGLIWLTLGFIVGIEDKRLEASGAHRRASQLRGLQVEPWCIGITAAAISPGVKLAVSEELRANQTFAILY